MMGNEISALLGGWTARVELCRRNAPTPARPAFMASLDSLTGRFAGLTACPSVYPETENRWCGSGHRPRPADRLGDS
jgi:hypothetical protein